jgi:hypothetical protein
MKMLAEYLENAIKFEQMAAEEKDATPPFPTTSSKASSTRSPSLDVRPSGPGGYQALRQQDFPTGRSLRNAVSFTLSMNSVGSASMSAAPISFSSSATSRQALSACGAWPKAIVQIARTSNPESHYHRRLKGGRPNGLDSPQPRAKRAPVQCG